MIPKFSRIHQISELHVSGGDPLNKLIPKIG